MRAGPPSHPRAIGLSGGESDTLMGQASTPRGFTPRGDPGGFCSVPAPSGSIRNSRLKIKGQPRSGETGMIFMPPRRARSGRLTIGQLQGLPEAHRVIFELREATLLSLNGWSRDGWGAEGINRSAQSGRSSLGAL